MVIVTETKTINVVREATKAFRKHSRHIATAKAATLHHLLQFQMGIQISSFSIDELFYLCCYPTCTLFSQFIMRINLNIKILIFHTGKNSRTSPYRHHV